MQVSGASVFAWFHLTRKNRYRYKTPYKNRAFILESYLVLFGNFIISHFLRFVNIFYDFLKITFREVEKSLPWCKQVASNLGGGTACRDGGIVKNKIHRWTIPQPPSASAPFTQGSLFMFIYDLSFFMTSTAFVATNAKYGTSLSRYTVFCVCSHKCSACQEIWQDIDEHKKAPLCKGSWRRRRLRDCFYFVTNCYNPPSRQAVPPPFTQGRLFSTSRKVIKQISLNIFTNRKKCDTINMLHKTE